MKNFKFLVLVMATLLIASNSFAFGGFAFGGIERAKFKKVPKEFRNAQVIEDENLIDFDNAKSLRRITVYPYDPINKKYYDKAFAGEVYRAGFFSSYTHWRYVTAYDVEEKEEPIAYLPYYEEECYDDSFRHASWGESRSLKVSLKSEVATKVGTESFGLSSSISISVENGLVFSTSRNIKATLGLKARHYPYKKSETFVGKTWIQTYNSKTGQLGYLLPSIADNWFDSYPYEFELNNQNVGFVVKREVIKYCESEAEKVTAANRITELLEQ